MNHKNNTKEQPIRCPHCNQRLMDAELVVGTEEGIVSALLAQNYAQCKLPLVEKEIMTIDKSISRYEPNKKVYCPLS